MLAARARMEAAGDFLRNGVAVQARQARNFRFVEPFFLVSKVMPSRPTSSAREGFLKKPYKLPDVNMALRAGVAGRGPEKNGFRPGLAARPAAFAREKLNKRPLPPK